jgi:hypothetical protein
VLDEDGNVLEPATSLGFAAIEFAEEIIGIQLFPWQRWLLIHALELREDGSFRFRNVVVLIARQNGKSTLSQILSLFFLFVVGARLVLGTAQDLDTAEEVWDGALELIEGNRELHGCASPPRKVNGGKTIRLRSGERYKVKAASRRAGRGLSGDLILLDELREHTNWEAWGAITKTTMARANAQVWSLSNAGDAASIVLRYLRKMAHQALGDPDGIVANEDPSRLLDPDDVTPRTWPSRPTTRSASSSGRPPRLRRRRPDGWARPTRPSGTPSPNAPSPRPCTPTRSGSSAPRSCASGPTAPWRVRSRPASGTPASTGAPDPAPPESVPTPAPDRPRLQDRPLRRRLLGPHQGPHRRRRLPPDGLPHVEIIASRLGTDWVKGWFTDPEHPERLPTTS